MYITHIEDGTHNTLSFEAKTFFPLSYVEFCIARGEGFKSFKISCATDSVRIEKNGVVESSGPGRFDLPINFSRALPVYALVKGGWLPPSFVQPPNLLADSNAIGNLEAINRGNVQPLYEQLDWWFKLPNESNLTINPVLYALEGNQLRTPTFEELKSSFETATEVIMKRFPKAKIIEYKDVHFQAAFKLITSISKQNEREEEFLIKAAPLVTDGVPSQNLPKYESEIIKIAQETKLDLKSLSVLTVLSCLYDDGRSGFTAARKILFKSRSNYTRTDAYNALADLNALRFFIGLLAPSESNNSEPFALCTSDKALVLLWSGFYFYDIKFVKDAGARSSFLLSENLFPRLSETQRKELAAKLS